MFVRTSNAAPERDALRSALELALGILAMLIRQPQRGGGQDMMPKGVYTRVMDFFCYNTALRAAARQATAIYDAALAPAGIGSAQFTLMKTLAANQPLALTELGVRLGLERSTIGRNVRVLEKAGLLSLGGGIDARETAVALTAQGEAILAEATPLWKAAQGTLERRLGKAGASDLRAVLLKLKDDTSD